MGRVGVGVGDMKKATYDPDKDGQLALAQLVAAVCSETEADGKITTHAGVSAAHHTPTDGAMAIIDLFQVTPATGTTNYPERMNDNNTGSVNSADAVNEYSEVDFGHAVYIRRWRQFGKAQASTGVFKLEYYDGSWHDWVTGIAIRPTADWSAYITETERLATKIRMTHTTIDGGGFNYIGEIEVIY